MTRKTVAGSDSSLAPPAGSPYVRHDGDWHYTNAVTRELLQAMIERGVPLRTMARGLSMHPFIRDRDILTISPLGDRPLSPGDVVAFAHPHTGRLAIHRLIQPAGEGWLIRGDNMQKPDGVVSTERIMGWVSRVERAGVEISLGRGRSGRLIARLNRGELLTRFKQLGFLPRRAVRTALRGLLTLSGFRRLARRLAPPVSISVADEQDMEAVQSWLNPGGPYPPVKPNPHVTNFVAKTTGRWVGFAQLVYHPEDHHPWVGWWVFSVVVRGPWKGLGYGEGLTGQCIAEAISRGAPELFLVVYHDNTRAVQLYRKLGFAPVTLPALEPQLAAEHRETGRRRIVMKKPLR